MKEFKELMNEAVKKVNLKTLLKRKSKKVFKGLTWEQVGNELLKKANVDVELDGNKLTKNNTIEIVPDGIGDYLDAILLDSTKDSIETTKFKKVLVRNGFDSDDDSTFTKDTFTVKVPDNGGTVIITDSKWKQTYNIKGYNKALWTLSISLDS